jgi:hypothetical protein
MFDDMVEGIAAPDAMRTIDLLIKMDVDYNAGLQEA